MVLKKPAKLFFAQRPKDDLKNQTCWKKSPKNLCVDIINFWIRANFFPSEVHRKEMFMSFSWLNSPQNSSSSEKNCLENTSPEISYIQCLGKPGCQKHRLVSLNTKLGKLPHLFWLKKAKRIKNGFFFAENSPKNINFIRTKWFWEPSRKFFVRNYAGTSI